MSYYMPADFAFKDFFLICYILSTLMHNKSSQSLPSSKTDPRSTDRQRVTTIGKISALDSNCLFQGMDSLIKKQSTSLQTPEKAIKSSSFSSSSSYFHQIVQKIEVPTSHSNQRSTSKDISNLESQELTESKDSFSKSWYKRSNAEISRVQQRKEVQSKTTWAKNQSFTERSPNIPEVIEQGLNVELSNKGDHLKVQKIPNRNDKKHFKTDRKKVDLFDDIFNHPKPFQNTHRGLKQDRQQQIRGEKLLILCLQKLFSAHIKRYYFQLFQKIQLRKTSHYDTILIHSLRRIFKLNQQKIFSFFFKILKQTKNEFVIGSSSLKYTKKNLVKKKTPQIQLKKQVLPNFLLRFQLQQKRRIFSTISKLIKKKKTQTQRIRIGLCLRTLCATKMREFFRKLRSTELTRSKKYQGAQNFEFFLRFQLNKRLRLSFSKILKKLSAIRHKNIEYSQAHNTIIKSGNKIEENTNEEEVSQLDLQMILYQQLQACELKQQNSEQTWQNQQKQAKKKQLQQILKNLPQQVEEVSITQPSSFTLLLTKIYFSLNNSVDVNSLGQAYGSLTNLSQSTNSWCVLHKNLKYKHRIEAYEQKLIEARDGTHKCETKDLKLSALQEQREIQAKIRSYIKEQYYWSRLKSLLLK